MGSLFPVFVKTGSALTFLCAACAGNRGQHIKIITMSSGVQGIPTFIVFTIHCPLPLKIVLGIPYSQPRTITLLFTNRVFNTNTCWLLPSNQTFYRQIASYQRGVGDQR